MTEGKEYFGIKNLSGKWGGRSPIRHKGIKIIPTCLSCRISAASDKVRERLMRARMTQNVGFWLRDKYGIS